MLSVRRAVLDLLFPARCLSCNALGSFYCATCRTAILRLPDPLCPSCHRTVDANDPYCRCRAPSLRYVAAVGEYTGPLRHAIHRFKYAGQRAAYRDLAALLYPIVSTLIAGDKLIMPVPLHPKRHRQRGYNQSLLLARVVAEDHRDMFHEHALKRVKRTTPQVGLSASERQRNLDGAFQADPAVCIGRDVVLIDDVCTTGATLRSAAHALHSAGARNVYGAVLAMALPGNDH
ncbi:MAG: putative phosphoribosyltransferase [Chloroflexi bacterium]|nr:putative phosphoribosyltransferase [Chloroflexota bacterium]